jgi:dolichol-phosphate mannosyltransferase
LLDLLLRPFAETAALDLTVVVPSFKERENVRPLLDALDAALSGIAWEVIWVDDDSPDGTAEEIREIARTDRRVRCVQRIGRRGLSTAVIEGMLASSAPYLAVIDADMQHDEKLLPDMLALLQGGDYHVVIGSRYVDGGRIGAWSKGRAMRSRIATRLARIVMAADVRDPMSGYFMITRPAFEFAVRRLSGQGFKILLDLFASTRTPYKFKELPYTFRQRIHGESKLDSLVVWEYVMLLLDKVIGGVLPARFVLFGFVGTLGVLVHLSVLRLALIILAFPISQAVATVVAMTGNFTLNNLLTYRDKRLRHWRFVKGLLSFYLICSVGAVAGVGVASAAFAHNYTWWLSGLAGAVIGVVWNYTISSVFTWGRR